MLGTRRADLGVRWHHHWPVNGQLPSRGSWDTCVITPRVITAIHLGVDGQSRGLFVDLHRFAPIKERVSLPFRLPFASPIASFHPLVPRIRALKLKRARGVEWIRIGNLLFLETVFLLLFFPPPHNFLSFHEVGIRVGI